MNLNESNEIHKNTLKFKYKKKKPKPENITPASKCSILIFVRDETSILNSIFLRQRNGSDGTTSNHCVPPNRNSTT